MGNNKVVAVPPVATSTVAEGGHVSGAATAPSDADRIRYLEDKLAIVEKQLQRLESFIASPRGTAPLRSKTVVINYDLGPDAQIDTRDIAWGAFGAFGLAGMVVGRSLAKNLWLLGGLTTGAVAAYLCREEEGGALSDVIRAVGYRVASKVREGIFLWRTGKLSYIYFQKWEVMDKKYRLMDKWMSFQAFGQANFIKAKEFERKHELGTKFKGFLLSSADAVVEGVTRVSNAKDRAHMISKLPKPLRRLFTSKEQRKQERLKKYRVGFMGQRLWRPFDDED